MFFLYLIVLTILTKNGFSQNCTVSTTEVVGTCPAGYRSTCYPLLKCKEVCDQTDGLTNVTTYGEDAQECCEFNCADCVYPKQFITGKDTNTKISCSDADCTNKINMTECCVTDVSCENNETATISSTTDTSVSSSCNCNGNKCNNLAHYCYGGACRAKPACTTGIVGTGGCLHPTTGAIKYTTTCVEGKNYSAAGKCDDIVCDIVAHTNLYPLTAPTDKKCDCNGEDQKTQCEVGEQCTHNQWNERGPTCKKPQCPTNAVVFVAGCACCTNPCDSDWDKICINKEGRKCSALCTPDVIVTSSYCACGTSYCEEFQTCEGSTCLPAPPDCTEDVFTDNDCLCKSSGYTTKKCNTNQKCESDYNGPKCTDMTPCSSGVAAADCMCGSNQCSNGQTCENGTCLNGCGNNATTTDCACGSNKCSNGQTCESGNCLNECGNIAATSDCKCGSNTCSTGQTCESGGTCSSPTVVCNMATCCHSPECCTAVGGDWSGGMVGYCMPGSTTTGSTTTTGDMYGDTSTGSTTTAGDMYGDTSSGSTTTAGGTSCKESGTQCAYDNDCCSKTCINNVVCS